MQRESDWRTYKTSSKYVAESITKYGISNFQFEILQLFDTRAGVVSGEVELQWQCKVLHAIDEHGEREYWNQAIGNIKFIAKEQLSDEHKAKVSRALTGIKRSEETREKISKARTGKSYPHKGVPCSEDTKAKMSQVRKNKPKTEEHKAKIAAALIGNRNSTKKQPK